MSSFNIMFMLKIAAKHWIPLVLAAVIAAAAGYGYAHYLQDSKFSAAGSIMVTNGEIISDSNQNTSIISKSDRVEGADISASLGFTQTVIDILETPEIYKQLAENMGNEYSYSQLKGMISVARRETNSLFIDISIVTDDAQQSVRYLNGYLSLAPDYIKNIVPNTASYVTLADRAGVIRQSTVKVMMVCAVVGVVIVYLIIFLISASDTVIRDEETLRDHLGVDIIGVVPDFTWAKTKENKYYKSGRYYAYGYGGKKNVSEKT